MRYIHLYTVFWMLVVFAACVQKHKKGPYRWSESNDSTYFNSMVRNILHDKNGNIIIAYNKGVVRYDGKTFTDLTSRAGSPMFWDVLEDKKGNFWFATRDSGVYYYNKRSLPVDQSGRPAQHAGFKHFTTKNGLANNRVMAMYEDTAGNIWFGTESGVSRYDGRSFRNFTTKDGLPNNTIAAIAGDDAGKLWFGTGDELCFYNGKTFTVFRNKDGKTFTGVKSIIKDRKGNIVFDAFLLAAKKRISPGGVIVYGEHGLWRYDGIIITKISERRATAMIEDKKGNIWTTGGAGPDEGGWALSRFDEKALYSKTPVVTEIMLGAPRNLNSRISGLLEANDGSIWFGGPKGGLYRYDGKKITVF